MYQLSLRVNVAPSSVASNNIFIYFNFPKIGLSYIRIIRLTDYVFLLRYMQSPGYNQLKYAYFDSLGRSSRRSSASSAMGKTGCGQQMRNLLYIPSLPAACDRSLSKSLVISPGWLIPHMFTIGFSIAWLSVKNNDKLYIHYSYTFK